MCLREKLNVFSVDLIDMNTIAFGSRDAKTGKLIKVKVYYAPIMHSGEIQNCVDFYFNDNFHAYRYMWR